MKILGFNPSHHSSVCLLEDGKIKFFLQEDRLSRIKNSHYPFKLFIDLLQQHSINAIAWGTPSLEYPVETNSLHLGTYWEKIALALNNKKDIKIFDYSSKGHHVTHAASTFFNSGFKEAAVLVVDGVGSIIESLGRETETIYTAHYPCTFNVLYKNIISHQVKDTSHKNYYIDSGTTVGMSYGAITMHLGWDRNEAGKTMGLSSYGKFSSQIPQFFNSKNRIPLDIMYTDWEKKGRHNNHDLNFINETTNPQLTPETPLYEWHYNPKKIRNIEKDLAYQIQKETQEIVGDYIEKIIDTTGITQICCAGGYFLNCVANYYLVKRFPKVKFYFEPNSNDAGTAIGAAQLAYREITQDKNIYPQTTLYHGPQYTKEQLLKGIQKYLSN
jgi:carbamoyltransferase